MTFQLRKMINTFLQFSKLIYIKEAEDLKSKFCY